MKSPLLETVVLFLAMEGFIQIVEAGDGMPRAPNESPNYFQGEERQEPNLLIPGGKARALKRPGLSIFVADTVVNYTDPSFKKSGAFDPEEISIAVDPKNTDRIVITVISGGPDATVMRWQSRDGGVTWNKELTINSPQASGALDQEDFG